MTKVEELKPCPFCGGKPTLHQPRGALGAWISCAQCGLEGPTETGVTEADATAHWNSRAAISASDALTAGEREPVAIPDGWFLVPEVPTDRQMDAGLYQASHDAQYEDVCQSYMDMVRTPIDAPVLYTSPPASELEALDEELVRTSGLYIDAISDRDQARACLAEALKALEDARALVSEAAMTGFNCHDGDWADRLYANNGKISAVLGARRVRDGGQADG